ncbi:hypothetical protein AI28_07055 [bacteria symbiont BFo1 of Frankliniella occidentalis]|nr:hypothetical protein AI28_07055 [bacteria symbiont BFo1 of Frankliniella occidentalis]
MKSLARREFHFHNSILTPVQDREGIWFTSTDLAKALGYASTKSISNLYSGNSDEFSVAMSMVIGVMTNGINNNLREKKVRIFSLRGAHLIAMFARTPVAKEFRRWVLDILDREVANGNVCPTFDFEMHAHNAKVAKNHFDIIYQAWNQQICPSLRAVNSPLAVSMIDRLKDVGAITFSLVNALEKEAGKSCKRMH